MIAVLGATGNVGRRVAGDLAARGLEARAVVRSANVELPLPTIQADLDIPESLPVALDGVQRLLLLTAHGPFQERQERTAIYAAVAAGVERIVKISGTGPSLGPNGPTPTALAHWQSEQRIERSGLEFTFLRPCFYMQNLLDTVAPAVSASGILPWPLGAASIAMIDAHDVAACAVAALLSDDGAGRAWQLTGPRAVTFRDIARRIGARPVTVPIKLAVRAMRRRGAGPFELEHAARMAAYFASGADGVATEHVLRLTGQPPRAVEEFLDEHRAAFAPATPLAHHLSRRTTSKGTG